MFWLFGKSQKSSAPKDKPRSLTPLKLPLKCIIGELGGEILEVTEISPENLGVISPKPLEPGQVVTIILDLSLGSNEESLTIRGIVDSSTPVKTPRGRRYELYIRPLIKGERQHIVFNRKLVLLLSALTER